MKAFPFYVADAFATALFGGNPAAIAPLENWLPDELMQQLAAENNLSETAFIVPKETNYEIRWFTPGTEVNLCGHATLAAAHIYFNHLNHPENQITFYSKSGPLVVSKEPDGKLTLDFPSNPPEKVEEIPAGLFEGLGITTAKVFKTNFDYMVVLEDEATIQALQPDFKLLATVKARGVICTAKGNEADFVSRCFYPQSGVDEDPVTGSAHTITIPYWASILGKDDLFALQLSKRRGTLYCQLKGSRVLMSGNAITYSKGEYYLPS
jgi:PhzF family phenazine biosynthesis protein